jgi:uncharacterized membrane protein
MLNERRDRPVVRLEHSGRATAVYSGVPQEQGELLSMFLVVGLVLIALWLFSLTQGYRLGGGIHVFLALGACALLIQLFAPHRIQLSRIRAFNPRRQRRTSSLLNSAFRTRTRNPKS